MYKTAITLQQKIRSTAIAALLALTALSATPLTASAGTPLPKGNDFRLQLDKASMAAIRAQVDRDFQAEAQHLWHAPHGICVGDSEHQQP